MAASCLVSAYFLSHGLLAAQAIGVQITLLLYSECTLWGNGGGNVTEPTIKMGAGGKESGVATEREDSGRLVKLKQRYRGSESVEKEVRHDIGTLDSETPKHPLACTLAFARTKHAYS